MEIDVKEGKKEEKKEDSMSDFLSEMMGSLPALKKRVYFIMDSGPMQVFLITLLLLSLFITDAWTLGNPADSLGSAWDVLWAYNTSKNTWRWLLCLIARG